MSYRRLVVLYGLILLLVACQTYSLGADDHGPAAPEPTGSSTARPDADDKLSPEIAKSIAKLFPVFSETAANERYGVTLPKAFVELRKNNEEPIADIIAEIFGTLNDQQVEKLVTDVDAEIKAEKDKERDKQDLNKIKFLERVKEAALSVKKKDGDKDLAKFREAFEKKFQAVKDKNKEFYKLLDDALTNDAAKRKLLDGGYDPELLLRFAKEQCATGNQALCDKLAKGLTFEDKGEKFIDVVNKEGKNQRLQIGKEADFKDSLADLAEQTKGFGGFKLATKPHETVEEANIVRPKKRPAQPTTPQQQTGGSNPPTRPGPPERRTGSPGGSTGTGSGSGSSGSTGSGSGSGSGDAAALEAKTAEVSAIAKAACVTCHGPSSRRATKFDANGKLVSGSVAEILKRTTVDKDMPDGGELSASQMASIQEWARLQNVR